MINNSNDLSFKFGTLTSLLDSNIEKSINNGDFLLASYSNKDNDGVENFGSTLYFGYNDSFIPITQTPGLENLPLIGTGLSSIPQYSSKFTASELFFAHNDSLNNKAGSLIVDQEASELTIGETLFELGSNVGYEGALRLFGPTGGFTNVKSRNTVSANSTFYLPDPQPQTRDNDIATIDAYAVWHKQQIDTTGNTNVPVYIDSDGCAVPIDVLSIDYGGTGTSIQYSNRLVFTDDNGALISGVDEIIGHATNGREIIVGDIFIDGNYPDWYNVGQDKSNYQGVLGVNGALIINNFGITDCLNIVCETDNEDLPYTVIHFRAPSKIDGYSTYSDFGTTINIPFVSGNMAVLTSQPPLEYTSLPLIFSNSTQDGQLYGLDGVRLNIEKTQLASGIMGGNEFALGTIDWFATGSRLNNARAEGILKLCDGFSNYTKIKTANNKGLEDLEIPENTPISYGTSVREDGEGKLILNGTIKTIEFQPLQSESYSDYRSAVKNKYIEAPNGVFYYCFWDATNGELLYYELTITETTFILPSKESGTDKYYATWMSDNNTDIGSADSPVYVNSYGEILPCDKYANGTQLNINSKSYAGKEAIIYAPESYGPRDYVLIGQGIDNPEPIWINQNTLNVLSAVQDSSGHKFEDHYSTKAEAASNLGEAKAYTDALGQSLSGTTQGLLDALKRLVEAGDNDLIGSIGALTDTKADKTISISVENGLVIDGNSTLADDIVIKGVAASETDSGIVTTDEQSFSGKKIFTTIETTSLIVVDYDTMDPEDYFDGNESLVPGQVYFKILPDEE